MRASGKTGWCWTGKENTVGRGDRDACWWQAGVVLDWEKKTLSGEVTAMRAGGKTGWCWTGKKAVGQASEAMPAYYKKTLSGEVTAMRAGG